MEMERSGDPTAPQPALLRRSYRRPRRKSNVGLGNRLSPGVPRALPPGPGGDPGARAFSLLETMVAASVLVIGLLALLSVMPPAIMALEQAREDDLALRAISNEIDLLNSQMVPLSSTSTPTLSQFIGQTTFDVSLAGLWNKGDGSAPAGTITFLTEAETNAYFQSTKGVDLDWDGVTNGTAAASTTTPWQSYGVRLSVSWGDRFGGSDHQINVYTILLDRDG